MLRKRIVVLSFLNLLHSSPTFAQCYHPDLTLVTSTDYQPCTSDLGLASMCCATNRTQDADTCLPNGLCQSYEENSADNGIITLFWRESCTDPLWQSDLCLKLCITGADSEGDVLVDQCPDGSFCCGQFNTSCCNAGQGVKIASIIGSVSSTTVSSAATSTTSASSSVTTISSSTTANAASSTSTPASSPPLNSGAKIGIGVGVGIVGMLALVLGGAFLFRRRKNGADSTERKYEPVNSVAASTPFQPESPQFAGPKQRLAHELPSGNQHVELEDLNYHSRVNEMEAPGRRT